jgi:hypothetical protein
VHLQYGWGAIEEPRLGDEGWPSSAPSTIICYGRPSLLPRRVPRS